MQKQHHFLNQSLTGAHHLLKHFLKRAITIPTKIIAATPKTIHFVAGHSKKITINCAQNTESDAPAATINIFRSDFY